MRRAQSCRAAVIHGAADAARARTARRCRCDWLVTFWPSGGPRVSASAIGNQKTYEGKVVALHAIACQAPNASGCVRVTVRLQGGPDKGKQVGFNAGETSADQTFSIGETLHLYRSPVPAGASFQGQKIDQYGFSDFERHRPLILLAILFALLAVARRSLARPPRDHRPRDRLRHRDRVRDPRDPRRQQPDRASR